MAKVFARYMIEVSYDEKLLSVEQREQAFDADRNLAASHPLTKGIEDLEWKLDELNELGLFNYLKTGKVAVSIKIKNV